MSLNNPYAISILKKPYDTTLDENLSMYDHLPYVRDIELCNQQTIALVSGNVIKYYRCNVSDAFEIQNQDDQFNSILRKHEQQHEKHLSDIARRKAYYLNMIEESNHNEID